MKQLVWLVGTIYLLFGANLSANPVRGDHITVGITSEATQITVAEPFWVAIELDHDPNWYSYWRNPGDSGLATRIDWELPEGVTVGPIHWPMPTAKPYEGLTNYGFGERVLLLNEVRLSENWPSNQSVNLKATVSWLVCNDVCIPGDAQLSLTLPTAESPQFDGQIQALFSQARAKWPQTVDWPASYQISDSEVVIDVVSSEEKFASASEIQFFPFDNELVDHATPLSVATDGTQLRLKQRKSSFFQNPVDAIEGIIRINYANDLPQAFAIRATESLLVGDFAALPIQSIVENNDFSTISDETALLSLPILLGLAFAGGILLNFMPCVFPILSLKALTLAESVHRRTALVQSVAYTGGVLLCFVALASVLLVLRATGQQLGWGFQLQSPFFIASLTFLLFIMALSLSGVVHFGTQLGGVGEKFTRSSDARGAFFTGILAVIVASPCTAPFMGTALGVALVRPPIEALLIFATLGLGMALPLALVGILPVVHRLLPRPGAWMLTLKQVLAFPLYLTAVWLLWVFGQQRGVDDMAILLIGLVIVAFGLWLWEQRLTAPRWQNALSLVLILSAFGVAFSPLLGGPSSSLASPLQNGRQTVMWEVYSPERLAELRAAHRPVFVNLTAAWCITCLVNERTALSSELVQNTFREKGIIALKGDWTNGDVLITELLSELGRSGVPVYALYLPNQSPKLLPQLLTVNTVIDALETL